MNIKNKNFHTGVKEVIIISLGGSLIIPDQIDAGFLKDFKKDIEKYFDKVEFDYNFQIIEKENSKKIREKINLNLINVSKIF